MHIHLFLADRLCLVVGGGKAALQQVRLLLEAGALVSVIAPDIDVELADLSCSGRITHQSRPFETSDPEGFLLVYAATESRGENRRVLDACRALKILCSCVDGNWNSGDFSTPSSARYGSLMLSVSSGGNRNRESSMVQENLIRHLKMIDSARLVVVGTDHKHMTLEEREPFHLAGPRYEQAGFMIMQLWGIHEFMILNTCNRVEVIAVVSEETAKNGILRHIMGFSRLKEDKYYLKTGPQAFEHLCLVTAGMLSQTPGENHITAQVKGALTRCMECGWAGNRMQEWISTALHVSKQIKSAMGPQQHRDEIEGLALRYLKAEGRMGRDSTLLVLGAGMVGQALVRASWPEVKKVIWCYHVNRPERSTEWADRVELCTFNEIKNRLAEANVMVSAADSSGYLLHLGHAPFFDQEKPVVLVDLGMPRNIDPALDDLSAEISVVDLDGLKYWHRRDMTGLNEVLTASRRVIAEHMNLYEKIADSFKDRDAAE